jgi:hypothetical protein
MNINRLCEPACVNPLRPPRPAEAFSNFHWVGSHSVLFKADQSTFCSPSAVLLPIWRVVVQPNELQIGRRSRWKDRQPNTQHTEEITTRSGKLIFTHRSIQKVYVVFPVLHKAHVNIYSITTENRIFDILFVGSTGHGHFTVIGRLYSLRDLGIMCDKQQGTSNLCTTFSIDGKYGQPMTDIRS